ncbi:ABC transporter substrate-binding protein [Pigmentiphaga aceris]|uniref:ABC transporter substrate-binding protein n=1 Tax=Pigmentiphaga aceris TaxID=1940612 RepID=A0A5C0B123_9BURK|nr:ABC transporter substrate-binding protein [Pigmentiphaga aceris]QEI07666.1 ABC transporter substrate-binding protein [Pigmentiphaga aceris]
MRLNTNLSSHAVLKTIGQRTSRFLLNAAVATLGLSLSLGAVAQTASTTAAPVPTDAAKRGGTLTWIVTPEPAAFVPLTTTAGGSTDLGPKVVEGLFNFDVKLQPIPALATAWQVTPDGLRYTFTLRKGVKWHDGKDFSAADVVFSIETLKTVHPRGRVTFANVRSIEAPDAHTVILLLDKPAPYLLTALDGAESPIIPKHLYEGKDIASNPLNNAPIGTGPFVFKEWVRGSYVKLERNPNYWDQPRPYLDAIVARFIPDAAARAAALESGEVQLGNKVIPLSDIERFKALPKITVDITAWPYVGDHQQIYFNLDSEPFKRREVRLAVAQALNLDVFAKTIWYGHGVPSATPIGAASPFHNPAIKRYPYDVKAAEAALDAAGYKRGADGKRFAVRLLNNPFQDRRAADFVRQSLIRIGIDAELQTLDFATYVTRVYTDRAFDITLENLTNVFDPTIGVQRVFWSKNFKVGLPFSNAPHYVSADADRLLEAAAGEADAARRRALFFEFQEVIHRDIPSIELGANPNVTIAARNLHDWGVNAGGVRANLARAYFSKP